MALLEADVNFKVVKAFIDRVRDRAVDQEVLKSLTPAQQVVRIVRDEMLALFGERRAACRRRVRPRVVLMLGLQGSGKTTTGGKTGQVADQAGAASAARVDRRAPARGNRAAVGRRPNRPACGFTIRPAKWIRSSAPTGALAEAKNAGFDVVIVDTAGRLHIDDELMDGVAGDQGRRATDRPAVRRRCDDRAGRDQERRRVQPAHRRHRRGADEDGR